MNNALMFIGCLLVAIFAALFAVPYFIDWNGYRGVFEEEASRILGREVRVGGSVNVRLLPAPFVSFEKIRIADTTGDGGDSFFRTESFTMWLSVPPLLQGVLQAHDVELRRPVLKLAADADGSNWNAFSINPGQLPFVPAGVTLQSVRIIDGVVNLARLKGGDLVRLEGINGELAGDAIDGPYRFGGTVAWQGLRRDIRAATSRPEADGGVRFKASVRAKESPNWYSVDGRVSDLKGKPKISGELTASLAVAPPASAAVKAKPAEGAAKAEQQAAVAPGNGAATQTAFDLRSKFSGDAGGINFTEIALTREDGGPPQLVTGEAKSSWTDRVKLTVAIASKWLDLDRIAGTEASHPPLVIAQGLLQSLVRSLPADAETAASLRLDQVNLGGNSVSDVSITVTRADGPLELTELRAALPGRARIDMKGTLTDGDGLPGFQGPITLRGQSLGRFLGWGLKDASFAEGRGEVPFSLQGRLAIGDSEIGLTEAAAELGGVPLEGELRFANDAHKRLALVVEGYEIDTAQFWPGGLHLSSLGTLLLPMASADDDKADASKARAPGWIDPATSDITIRLKTAMLNDGDFVLRDVDADLRIEDGKLTVPALKFKTDTGLAIDIEGQVVELAKKPKGALRGQLAAARPGAIAEFVRIFSLPALDAELEQQLSPLAPARLAFNLVFGERTERAADLTLDGVAGGGRIVASLSLDGGLSAWRKSPIEVSATIESPNVSRMLSVLSPESGQNPLPADRSRRGLILLKAAGTPESGLVTLASVGSADLALSYDGSSVLASGFTPALEGEIKFSAREPKDVLSLIGLPIGASTPVLPMEGIVGITKQSAKTDIAVKRVSLGNSVIAGRMSVARKAQAPTQFSADLEVDRAAIPDLMDPLLRPAQIVVPVPVPATTGATAPAPPPFAAGPAQAKSVWPERTFDFAALNRLEGDFHVRFGTLQLATGLGLTSAKLDVTVAPGRLAISSLTGETLGGRLATKLDLTRAAAGVTLNGSLALDDAHLDALMADGAKRISGAPATLTANFSGQALSPASLVSALRGKGEATLGETSMKGMVPWTIVATTEAALNGSVASSGEGLARALGDAIQQGDLKLGPRKVPIDIIDGVAKLAAFTVEGKDGKTSNQTTVDLIALEMDADWQIEPKRADQPAAAPGRPSRGQVPPVSVVYVGKLGEIATLKPRISTAALERELAVRRMELDVDALEKLRKLDEERFKQEIARQKALEAEQAKAAEAAAAGKAADTAPPPPVPAPGQGAAAASTDPGLPASPQAPGARPNLPKQQAPATVRRRTTGDEILNQLRPY